MVTACAVLCRRLRPNQRELSRKIVHIGTGAVVPLAWFFQIPFVVALPVATVITLVTALNHQWRFIPAVEDIDRNSYGTIAYGIAITMLLLLFWPTRADAVSAGVLVMALGDGLAGLIGRNVESPKWVLFGQTKSSVGTMTMAVVSSLVLTGLARWSGLTFPFRQPLAWSPSQPGWNSSAGAVSTTSAFPSALECCGVNWWSEPRR